MISFLKDEARKNNSKVLVHCQAGVSRSPTIVIAYIMKKYSLNLNEAYSKVREMRPIIAPNLIFMSQLMEFEAKLKPIKSTFNFAAAAAAAVAANETTSSNDNSTSQTTANSNSKTPIECN
jgi:dual specificity MAP kinase phosphatase